MKPLRGIACGRGLLKFAVSIPTAEGLLGWGPICGASVTIKRNRAGVPVVVKTRGRRRRPDAGQIPLFGPEP